MVFVGLMLGIFLISFVLKPFIDSMLPTLTLWGTGYEVAIWALLPIILLTLLIPLTIYTLKRRKKSPFD